MECEVCSSPARVYTGSNSYCPTCFFNEFNFDLHTKEIMPANEIKIDATLRFSGPTIAIVGPFQLYKTSYLYLINGSFLSSIMVRFVEGFHPKPIPANFWDECEKVAYKSYDFGSYTFSNNGDSIKKRLSKTKLEKILMVEDYESKEITKESLLEIIH